MLSDVVMMNSQRTVVSGSTRSHAHDTCFVSFKLAFVTGRHLERSDYCLERSDCLVERSDQRMERSDLERSGHGTK